MSITVTYSHELFDKKLRAIQRGLNRAAEKGARDLAAYAVELMETSPASGHIYTKAGGRQHQASAPGEPPAVDEGELINSVFVEKVGEDTWVAGFTDPKAPWLEYGTPTILPRPFIRPAAMIVSADLPALIKFYVEEES